MRSKVYFLATLLCSLLLFATSVKLFAEPPHERMSAEEKEERREKAGKMLETITLWKIVDRLKLTEEQLTKFLPKYRETKDLKKEYREKRKKVVEELKDLLQEKKVSAKKIESKLAQLDKLEEEQWQENKALQKELRGILTPEQQAKFIFLQRQIGREMMQQLRKRMKGEKEKGRQPREKRHFEEGFPSEKYEYK
ncbi:MAG: hypothetical protein KAX20_00025 [Candidatus Omnitrophica bacterium]|nr:hypothetical protein [Candidatus Omnitrophota bacterium]